MQSVLDNLCRCFGSDPANNMASNNLATSTMEHSDSILESDKPAAPERGDVDTTRQGSNYSRISLPPTPDLKRRTKSLSLQDKQWDNLFVSPETKKHARRKTQDDLLDGFSMEQAQAVARAKLEATQPNMNRKRRRGGKEDIFRSKKPDSRTSVNPVHRFLSNHPAIMNSLCFASPVKDSRSHEPTEILLHKDSMQSEAISTADDTVTSTVYYETTRLAGLQQKNPPMPLFDSFQVEDKDGEEIHRIIATHSHSSQRLREMFRQQDWKVDLSDDDEDEEDNDEDQVMQEDDIPPPMIHSSSESSRSSNGKRV
ncbi:hypothetical protein FisN_24Lh138 [Fistulifera solaris]|uniref:Uncharacterized protein n=1 Tax=Fistulifera solaris TaxID=1519565 RepID=A0A1Z5K983_FISSO|nr:hypothetical protein FisN_24Lh138 [Fistulifera solaris]|eukprot:GAX22853.1 hypothetical protein FisN_24Lh138 [Fistulifera solaris]